MKNAFYLFDEKYQPLWVDVFAFLLGSSLATFRLLIRHQMLDSPCWRHRIFAKDEWPPCNAHNFWIGRRPRSAAPLPQFVPSPRSAAPLPQFVPPRSAAPLPAQGDKVVEVKLCNGDQEITNAQWRRIEYGLVSPFAMLQSRRSSFSSLSKISKSPSPYHLDWWEYVIEYSKDISSLLGGQKLSPNPIIEEPKAIFKKGEEPTCLKAAWELMEIFYADKQSQAWLPERILHDGSKELAQNEAESSKYAISNENKTL